MNFLHTLRILWAELNQFGDKNILLPMYAIPYSPLRPVHAFKLMCSLVPAPSDAPTFCRISAMGPLFQFMLQPLIDP